MCGYTALVRCVLALRCGSAGVLWYPYAGKIKQLTSVGLSLFNYQDDARSNKHKIHLIRTPLQISTYSTYVNNFISNSALELYTGQQITYASVPHSKKFPGQHQILVSFATFRITCSTYPNINTACLHYRDTHLNDVRVRKRERARSSQKYLIQKPYAHSAI